MQKKLCVRLPPSAKMAGVGFLQSFVKLRFVALQPKGARVIHAIYAYIIRLSV